MGTKGALYKHQNIGKRFIGLKMKPVGELQDIPVGWPVQAQLCTIPLTKENPGCPQRVRTMRNLSLQKPLSRYDPFLIPFPEISGGSAERALAIVFSRHILIQRGLPTKFPGRIGLHEIWGDSASDRAIVARGPARDHEAIGSIGRRASRS